MDETERHEKPDKEHVPEDEHDREGGAEGSSSAAEKLPGMPASDDDSPLGDTDQHSDA